jgi:tetratricopeptide (TPR) repeat protein
MKPQRQNITSYRVKAGCSGFTSFFSKIIAGVLIGLFGLSSIGQNTDPYKALGDSLFTNGKIKEGIIFFEKENQKKPGDEQILRWLGYFHIQNNDLANGKKYYSEALKANPGCSRCYLNLGRIEFFETSDYKKALSLLDKAIALNPLDALAYATRGRVRELSGEKIGPVFDYNKAIELEPENPDHYINRGNYHASRNVYSMASADYTKAIQLAPGNYLGWFQRASLNYANTKLEESLSDINKAIQLSPGLAILYNGRAAVFSVSGDHKRAMEDYSYSLKLDSLNYFTWFNRALEQYSLEDMDGSCKDLHMASYFLKKSGKKDSLEADIIYQLGRYCDSNIASYYYQRGIANYNLGDFKKAIGYYDKGLERFPENSMLYSFRGNAKLALGRYETAIPDYENSGKYISNVMADIALNEKSTGLGGQSRETYFKGFQASNYLSLAECNLYLGNLKKALQHINSGINLAPEIPEMGRETFFNLRGCIYLESGDYQKARSDFEHALKLNSKFALAYVNLAVTLLREKSVVKISSFHLKNGINSPSWLFQKESKPNKKDSGFETALELCDKAINLDQNSGYAYIVRGQLKRILNEPDFCFDLIKAKMILGVLPPELSGDCK